MKIKSNILYAELNQFADKDSGVVNEMTKIVYTVEREASEKAVGCITMETYKPGNYLKELEPFTSLLNQNGRMVRPLVELDIEEQFIKNGKKFVVKSINDFDFSKKK